MIKFPSFFFPVKPTDSESSSRKRSEKSVTPDRSISNARSSERSVFLERSPNLQYAHASSPDDHARSPDDHARSPDRYMVLESSPDRQHVYARSPDLHERSPEPFSLPANLARSKHGSRSSPLLVVLQNHENNNRTKNSSNNNYNQIQNNPNKTPKNDFPKPDYSPVQIRKNGHYIKKVKFTSIKLKINVYYNGSFSQEYCHTSLLYHADLMKLFKVNVCQCL